MNLKTIFKVSLVILVIAVGEYLNVEKGPLQVGFLILFLVYIIGKQIHLRKTIRHNSQDVFVVKKNNWALAMVTWAVLAMMFLNNLNGIYLLVTALLVIGVMVMVAISESTEEYLINQEGITNLKTSERITIESISEIKVSTDALAIYTKEKSGELLIESNKLKTKSINQLVSALESIKKNRV